MLKDEIAKISDDRRRKSQAKEQKKLERESRIHRSIFYKGYKVIVSKIDDYKARKYDIKTQKIIEGFPDKLKRYAEKYEYADIYRYKEYFLTNPYLYENMSEYYLDERGKAIISFLKKNNISYCLCTHNHTIESYYTIRVIFK